MVKESLNLLSHECWAKPRNWTEAADFALCERLGYATVKYEPYPETIEFVKRDYPHYKITQKGLDKLNEEITNK